MTSNIHMPLAHDVGLYVGDLWFGHPVIRTMATHEWTGTDWKPRYTEEALYKAESEFYYAKWQRHESFQIDVDDWMDACFGSEIKKDFVERADRFLEEALELVQTVKGFNAERAHALVDYVFNRPMGDRQQEVGGVMVTLSAFCNVAGINIPHAARSELARVWKKIDQIRAKQAAKPTGSALPQ